MAQIPKVQFTLPGVSVFDIDVTNIGTMPIGKIIPVDYTYMLPGDTARCTLTHLARMAALATPAFAGFELCFESYFVPFRLLDPDTYEKFSYGKNPDGVDFLVTQFSDLYGYLGAGSLLDYLRYPVFSQLYKPFLSAYFEDAEDPSSGPVYEILSWNSIAYYNRADYFYRGSQSLISLGTSSNAIYPFFRWVYGTYVDPESFDPSLDNLLIQSYFEKYPSLESFLADFPNLTATSLIDSYLNYAFNIFVKRIYGDRLPPDFELSQAPILAYNRIYADRFVNTNIVDPDVINSLIQTSVRLGSPDESLLQLRDYWWPNDYFTGMLPTAAGEYQVPLPSEGTVQDLSSASALQRFLNRIWAAGKRYKDNVRAIFGWEGADQRLQYSQIIGSDSHFMSVSEVTQLSSGTEDSSLGDVGGKIVEGGQDRYHYKYTADEHGIIMTVAFVRTRAGYMDGIAPILRQALNTLDFVIPDMADIGFVPYTTEVLSGDINDQDVVFGYQRQYYPWIADFDHCHGEMKTTLDNWHVYRRFDDALPALNEDFLTMGDNDDIGRIFAVPEERAKILYSINFYKEVDRPLSRSIKLVI